MLKARFTLIILVLILSLQYVSAQSPYHLNGNRELSYLATSLGIGLTAMYINSEVEPLTQAEVNALRPGDVFSFDRRATSYNSQAARALSDHLQTASVILPLSFLIPKKTRKDFHIIGTMALEVMSLNLGVTGIFKGSVQRLRPFVYNENVPNEEKLTKNAKKSFFSGHTSHFAAMSFFAAKVISDYSDNKAVKITAWTVAAGTSGLMGYLRVRGGKHFTSDVVLGYLVGGAIGYLIPELHKNKKERKLSIIP